MIIKFKVDTNQPDSVKHAIKMLQVCIDNASTVAVERLVPNPPQVDQNQPVVEHAETVQEAKEVATLDLDTIKMNTSAKIEAGFKEEVRALLNKFKAKNVSSLLPEHYSDYALELLKIQ